MLSNCSVGEDSWESLGQQEIKPVHPKGNQPWMSIGKTDAEAEAPILWPPDVKNWLIWKDPDAGKDWGQEKAGTEDEMVGWHHWLNGHEFEQAPGDGEGQWGLTCCCPWGHKESDTADGLKNNKYSMTCMFHFIIICLSTEGHWGCFYRLALVNKAAMNMECRYFFETLISILYINTLKWGCRMGW